MSLGKARVPGFEVLAKELRDGDDFEYAVWLNLRDEVRVSKELRRRSQRAAIDSTASKAAEKIEGACRSDPGFHMTLRPDAAKRQDLPEEVAHFRTEDWLQLRDYLDPTAFELEEILEIKPAYIRREKTGPTIWCAFGEDSSGTDILDLRDANEVCLRLGLDFKSPGILRRIPIKIDRGTDVSIPTSLDAACRPPFYPQPSGRWGRTRDLRDDRERYREFLLRWPTKKDGPANAIRMGQFDVTEEREGYLAHRRS